MPPHIHGVIIPPYHLRPRTFHLPPHLVVNLVIPQPLPAPTKTIQCYHQSTFQSHFTVILSHDASGFPVPK
ncbi:hypothetical protein BC834DRAFT_898641 [Gloeopeniophorella convolvens]|nr:hypothetical protein BC834DRAFT_898641 [Gloeopeniophorella convolvens]